jgi:beta-glucanase (GH16 family)
MKKFIIFLLCLTTFTNAFSQVLNPACGKDEWGKMPWYSIDCDDFISGDWTLVFNDEFNGNELDKSKWFTCENGWNREHGDELQYYLDNNITVEDGILKLTAKREPGDYDVWRFDDEGGYITQKYFEYTSGWIQSKLEFKYGYFEIRCKIPEGKGFWPAFWLFGYKPNPKPEIDIFEFAGDEPKKHAINIREWRGKKKSNPNKDIVIDCSTKKKYGIDFSKGFHTFSAEWDEFKVIFRVDGEIKRIDYRYLDLKGVGLYDCWHHVDGLYLVNPYFPYKPSNLIANLAISHGPFGGPPNSSTEFPSSLEIDYIRVYKRLDNTKDLSICKIPDDQEGDVITGKTITVGGNSCNSVIKSGESLSLVAKDKIKLLPGFHAEAGSNFSAKIASDAGQKSSNLKHKKKSLIDTTSQKIKKDSFSSNDKNKDIIDEETYKIYPNPNKGRFVIQITKNVDSFQKIEILNINGILIIQRVFLNSDKVTIDLSDFPKGTYILKIIKDNNIFSNKIIYR